MALSGRPHGLEGAVIDRFGDKHIKIEPFIMEQVEDFITKWFRNVYSSESKIGQKTAQDMISEIKDHESVEKLIDNPLMLTAICILYHDGNELPGQRAELYKKFVNNLLSRRFPDDSEKIYNFLKLLAFSMHEKRSRGIDRAEAVKILESVYTRKEKENQQDYYQRLDKNFGERIEPACGLLKLERGEYIFHHLTFQEFLAATYLVSTVTDYGEAIETYWEDQWYKELIELYIGFLSIENAGWANKIVEDILKKEDHAPFNRWRLAARALINIHQDRRKDAVVNWARGRLLEIIDSEAEPKYRAEAGETLGWLGDSRDVKHFISIEGGRYDLVSGSVKMNAFEIGQYPVTNSWFKEFIKNGGYRNPDYWTDEGKKWLNATQNKEPSFWHDRKWNCPNTPVVGLCWYEADAFARWLTFNWEDGYEYRLPTENEWEAVAAGFEKRIYPWGNKWEKNKCNSSECEIGKTSPVGIFKKRNTFENVSDLGGNVWE